jgi:parvulin-like peptidyl-prolyl isomerase
MKGLRCLTGWRSLLFCCVLLTAGLLCGAAGAAEPASAPAAAAAAQPPVQVVGEVPLRPELQTLSGIQGWRINGEEISMQQVSDRSLAHYGTYVLQEMVAALLLRQEAKRLGITVSQQEVKNRGAELREEKGISLDSAFQRYLLTEGKTEAWFYDKVEEYLLLEKVLSGRVYVDDREVARFYNSYSEAYRRPETVWFRVMSFRTADAAQAAIQELRGGNTFEALAKAAADPQERAAAGELRQYSRGQPMGMPEEVEAALFSAPLNQVVGPITSQGQYHLFRVERKADAQRQKLEQQVYPNWLRTALSGAAIEPLKAGEAGSN